MQRKTSLPPPRHPAPIRSSAAHWHFQVLIRRSIRRQSCFRWEDWRACWSHHRHRIESTISGSGTTALQCGLAAAGAPRTCTRPRCSPLKPWRYLPVTVSGFLRRNASFRLLETLRQLPRDGTSHENYRSHPPFVAGRNNCRSGPRGRPCSLTSAYVSPPTFVHDPGPDPCMLI